MVEIFNVIISISKYDDTVFYFLKHHDIISAVFIVEIVFKYSEWSLHGNSDVTSKGLFLVSKEYREIECLISSAA